MNKTIKLRIKKEIDSATEKKILKLKGSLIAQAFTDIIHFDDDGVDFYINYFNIETDKKDSAILFVTNYLNENNIEGLELMD